MSPIAPNSRSWPTRRKAPEARAVLAACLLAAPLLAVGADYQTPALTAADVRAREQGPAPALVVDVRPNAEYKSGHVAGAVNIPYTQIGEHVPELSEAGAVVLYCTLGHRTKQAEQTLLDHDVANVFHLEGGLMAWWQEGYPIHTGWGP